MRKRERPKCSEDVSCLSRGRVVVGVDWLDFGRGRAAAEPEPFIREFCMPQRLLDICLSFPITESTRISPFCVYWPRTVLRSLLANTSTRLAT
jgi:hypothetical protein